MVDLVRQLKDYQRLTPSLILRALCLGDVGFFEASMAVLANASIVSARALIHDDGTLGLQSLYGRTNLPTALYPAFRIALDMVRSTEYDGGEKDRERFASKVIERVPDPVRGRWIREPGLSSPETAAARGLSTASQPPQSPPENPGSHWRR